MHERRQNHRPEREALGQPVGDPLVARHDLPRADLPPAHRGHEDVVLAPEHALGDAGRAPRIEDVEVVGRGLDWCALGWGCGERLLVPDRPGEEGVARFVGDLEQHVGGSQVGNTSAEVGRERRVENQRAGPGVVEQVPQPLADVAVVDVEGGDPGPVRAQHPLEILVAVVEGECDVVLSRLAARELGALVVHAQAAAVEIRGQAARASDTSP